MSGWLDTAGAAKYTASIQKEIRTAAALPESLPGALHGFQRKAPKGKWRFHTDCLDAWVEERVCVHRSNVRQLRSTA